MYDLHLHEIQKRFNDMKNRIKMSDQLITEYYEEYRRIVFFYICRRIDDRDDAEDLTQDAFLRLLEYRMMIRRDTLKYFLFTIVRNSRKRFVPLPMICLIPERKDI